MGIDIHSTLFETELYLSHRRANVERIGQSERGRFFCILSAEGVAGLITGIGEGRLEAFVDACHSMEEQIAAQQLAAARGRAVEGTVAA